MAEISIENLQKLTQSSKNLYKKISASRPDLLKFCQIENRANKFHLLVKIASPKNDPRCEINISFENDEDDITLFFGEWHSHGWELFLPTHEPIEEYVDLLDFVSYIQSDTFCLLYPLGEGNIISQPLGIPEIVDTRNQASVMDARMNMFSGGPVMLKSWSGKKDRVLT